MIIRDLEQNKATLRLDKINQVLSVFGCCVGVVQIPKDLEGGEGDIIFKTEDKKLFSYTPSENDVLIFSGDLEHMAVPNQSAIEDRLVYASNLSFSLEEETTFDTPIKFKNIIYDKKIVK